MVTFTQREIYTVLVHEAEEGGYWGEVPELPGCVSQGETIEELNANIREAIEAVTEGGDIQQEQITLLDPPPSPVADNFIIMDRDSEDWTETA